MLPITQIKLSHALYAGSFDPFTLGHLEVVEKSLLLFAKVSIVVANNELKAPFWSNDDRVDVIKKVFAGRKNVSVMKSEQLTVMLAREIAATHLVRGFRSASDFDHEAQLQAMNAAMAPEIETVFFMSSDKNKFISSTLVREIYKVGGDTSAFLPHAVFQFLQKSRQKKRRN